MNRFFNKKLILIMIFLISITLILFSIYKILTTRKAISNSLSQWEMSDYGKKYKVLSINNTEILFTDKKYIPVVYSKVPNNSEIFGKITILKSKEALPLIQGTKDTDLDEGAAHFITTVLPGEQGNSAIFGHRDGIFKSLKDVNINDKILIESSAGILVFKVIDTRIVLPDDATILKHYNDSIITLITCYPFHYLGSAPKRFIVIAKLLTN